MRSRCTGQIRDSETGQDFFNARYFTGALGRFNSPDPMNIGTDMTDPQTWDAYAYVRNNPLAYVDPTGLQWVYVPAYACAYAYDTIHDFGQQQPPGSQANCSVYYVLVWVPDPNPSAQPGSSGGGGGGGGQKQSQQSARTIPQRLACAAEFGQNHSIAAGFGAQNNFVANLFGGNTFSGLVNLGLALFGSKAPTASQLASIPLKGAAQGIPVPPGNPGLSGATGQIRSIGVQAAVNAGYNAIAGVGQETIELGITASGTVATPVGQLSTQTLTNVATGVGLAKFAFDLGTFLYGLGVECR